MASDPPIETQTVVAAPSLESGVPTNLKLVVSSGQDRGAELALRLGTFVVGKSRGCDLVLSDGQVSRRHLEILVTETGVRLRDLESRNGSYFNGARFESLVVAPGTTIVVGRTELKLTSSDEAQTLPQSSADHFGALVGVSPAMRRVFTALERVAQSDAAVLLQGETGTGKELAAEAIHTASARAGKPFVVCDLTGVPRAVIESELFGHLRGSFAGADSDRVGLFEQAHGGTFFLDEIGELDLDQQPRLLRALERRQVKPVGGAQYRTVDVRVVAATNRDLPDEVRAGRFRADLYHRLAVVRIELPPLRQRREDIPILIEHFMRQTASDRGGAVPKLPDETLRLLCAHDWPGNVRELRNVLERALALAPASGEMAPGLLGLDEPARGGSGITTRAQATAAVNFPFKEAKDRLIEAWERDYLTELLSKADGNVTQAARRAGLARAYLHELLRKHGLGGR